MMSSVVTKSIMTGSQRPFDDSKQNEGEGAAATQQVGGGGGGIEAETTTEGDVAITDQTDDNNHKTEATSTTTTPIKRTTKYVDHFSLKQASSTVSYRGARVHVYGTARRQFILEEEQIKEPQVQVEGDDEHQSAQHSSDTETTTTTITVKKMGRSNAGLQLLRLSYTLFSMLLAGFALAFCIQIILFLFLNFPIEAGRTSVQSEDRVLGVIGGILSIPVFLFGMSALMAMATKFVTDTWSGGLLLRSLMGWTPVLTEILYFVFFLVIPIVTLIVAAFLQVDDPWQICCYAWAICIAVAFVTFGLGVVARELQACFELVSIHVCTEEQDKSLLEKARTSLVLTQQNRMAGLRHARYLVSGDDIEPDCGYALSPDHQPVTSRTTLLARFSQLHCLTPWAFEVLDPSIRVYNKDEIRDKLPFITGQNWSLETFCCRDSRARNVTAAKGPAALKRGQILASILCNVFSATLVILVLMSFLVWMQLPWISYTLIGVLGFVFMVVPIVRDSWILFKTYQRINQAKKMEFPQTRAQAGQQQSDPGQELQQEHDTTMFHLQETVRITQPQDWLCYTWSVFEIGVFFVFPIATLFWSGNYPIAIVFIVMAVFSFLRLYFDAAVILEQLGSMSRIDVEKEPGKGVKTFSLIQRGVLVEGPARTLMVKSRLADLVGNIRLSGTVRLWIIIFVGFTAVVAFLMATAMASPNIKPDVRTRPPIVLVDDFYYPPFNSIAYPTCELNKGFAFEDGELVSLTDFGFLSTLAYERPQMTEIILGKWFGQPGAVVDEDALVNQWRIDSNTYQNPVYFKLFSVPSIPGFGVVAVRGSETNWDWLVNMQLWSSAGLAQAVKWLLPFGWIWTPILDEFVSLLNIIEDPRLKETAYYKVISKFVWDVRDDNYGGRNFSQLRLTGASLGGGLAIISGAQTGAYAVAVSGLGAELSRNTYDPPVTLDEIHNNVFDWIPDRDIIARIGGRPRQHQEAECLAPANSLFGCHSMWRSVCEMSYRCGSRDRPVICSCAETLGYPEPVSKGNATLTFAEACAEEQAAIEDIIATFPQPS